MITKQTIYRTLAWAALGGMLAVGVPQGLAQDEGSQSQSGSQKNQFSEKTSQALHDKLKPLQDAKDFAGMLALVTNLLAQVPPTSYDAAELLNMQARLYIQQNQLAKAIEPFEKAMALDDQYHYYDKSLSLQNLQYLSQVIFMVAADLKDKDVQNRMIADAAKYLKRYIDTAPKPAPDSQMLYAQILFYQATSDPDHVNEPLLAEARKIVEQGMLTSIHPKEGFYRLLLAILQNQNDLETASRYMEVMVSEYPQKKDMWQSLFSTYVNLAGNAKIEKQRREYYIRAINTIERAQKLGFLDSQRDNYNLFTLYANAGEVDMATDLLYNGMKSGKIESTLTNWRNLGLYYQQANKELQAISVLKEATKLFPKEGSIDSVIGQIYYGLEKPKEAKEAFEEALKKGNLGEKPHMAYVYLAYSDVELGDYDAGLAAIQKAASTPDGAKDPQVKSLQEGIKQMIEDRDRIKEAAAASAKKT